MVLDIKWLHTVSCSCNNWRNLLIIIVTISVPTKTLLNRPSEDLLSQCELADSVYVPRTQNWLHPSSLTSLTNKKFIHSVSFGGWFSNTKISLSGWFSVSFSIHTIMNLHTKGLTIKENSRHIHKFTPYGLSAIFSDVIQFWIISGMVIWLKTEKREKKRTIENCLCLECIRREYRFLFAIVSALARMYLMSCYAVFQCVFVYMPYSQTDFYV